ncbi:Reticulon-domain-containing protein [Thamnidium elegans]|nr:Reticulon-domain-containing protein [Thamnidium elegans]
MAINNMDHIETSEAPTPEGSTTRRYQKNAHTQRTETTRRIEASVLRILKWEDPISSGVILAGLIGSIILTDSYSLLQIIAFGLTLAIGVNLAYVVGSRVCMNMLADKPSENPYNHILENKHENLLSKTNAIHYSSVGVDVAETVARALTRIIFIEDTKTSVKWFIIFYLTWKISAFVSSRTIVTTFIISAFVLPRLYISNKDLVDARIQQSQALLNSQIQRTQDFANSTIADVKVATQSAYQKTTDSVTKKDE